jgi:ATP-binding cassette subfamily B protein
LSVKADEDTPRARPTLKALAPLLPLVRRHRVRAGLGLVALTAASAATLTIPMALRRVIDFGFDNGHIGLIAEYFIGLIGVVAVLAMASAARYYLVMSLGERIVADLRSNVFAHLTRLDAAFFDRVRSGEIVSRLTADTTQLKAAFGASASIALRNLMLFFGAVAMMVVTSPKLSALVLAVIPIIVLPLVGAGRAVRGRSRMAQDALAEAAAYATEQVGAQRVMQAFGAEARTRQRFTRATDDAYEAARVSLLARAWLTGFAIFLIFFSIVAILWLGAHDVASGAISAGRLSQFVLYAVFAAGALSQLSDVWGELAQAAGAAGRIGEILETEPEVAEPAHPHALPQPPRGEIAFEAVSFGYAAEAAGRVLGPLNLTIASGERVALVGPSGAGKTTIIQLILRFYDVGAGRLTIDGVDIRDVALADLRARIALVPQDPVIFAGTIAENIRYARPEADDAAVEQAARQAAAHDFITAMPEGYATPVGERGVTLSGGQRQRIAIARAILKDAPILLLDEATSALDAESEAAVQAALERLMEGRTSIVVAHRLATIRKAYRIVVLDGGVIVEEGTHDRLVAENGLYARLAALQFDLRQAAE